jgi:hypothetical protein
MVQDGHQGSLHPQRDPLPGQRHADASLLVSQADSSSSGLALSPHGRPLSFYLVRFAGRNYLRSELYGAITLALGQRVMSGNQLLLWPDRGARVPANAEPRSEGMQLILSVSRQAEQRRRRGRPAKEEPTPIAQFIHVHSYGILHSATLPMAKEPPRL